VGKVLTGGEPAIDVLPDAPQFTIALPDNQARMVTAGMPVDISMPHGSVLHAEVTQVTTGKGGATAHLGGADGQPACTQECALIPFGDAVLLPSTVHVVPEVSGVTVPAAAVVTAADGREGVVLDTGEFVPVTVVQGAGGMVVVEGIEAGTRVRTPGDAQ
jgi:hypothetical protein